MNPNVSWYLPSPATLTPGAPDWIVPAAAIAAAGIGALLLLRRRAAAGSGVGTLLRILGWLLIAVCLADPLWSSSRPRRGANVFAVVADISRSQQTIAEPSGETRAELVSELLKNGESSEPLGWMARIGQDFELHRYTVGERLERRRIFEHPDFEQNASDLFTCLNQLEERFAGQPLAGVLLISDGNPTDIMSDRFFAGRNVPVYPVLVGGQSDSPDVAVRNTSVSQTAFDDAPVTITVTTAAGGQLPASSKIRLTLTDDSGNESDSRVVPAAGDSPVRFQVRPSEAGTVFYRVTAELLDETGAVVTDEATLINNDRLIAVDRGGRKRRVLYVSGRPNWEFKFLRRAVETDPQTELVGLIRIAKREAKFDFRGRDGERSNSLFRGFDATEQEIAEEFDEPVMVRLGTSDAEELQGGFPKETAELFDYDALILDDIAAEFFTADQLELIYEFVSHRGGGLLMLGGQESFRRGEYDRTPVGELLPVDLSRAGPSVVGPLRLDLTRDGWLQPFMRLRDNEPDERTRLSSMPDFTTANLSELVRPGAAVMASVRDSAGNSFPALVTQRFGNGRTAALVVADLWRWRMEEGRAALRSAWNGLPTERPRLVAPGGEPIEDRGDYSRAARQMVRWLVADVPQRLDTGVAPSEEMGSGGVLLSARIRTRDFEPSDEADVRFRIKRPDGTETEIAGNPSDTEPGLFTAPLSAREPGRFLCDVTARVRSEDDQVDTLLSSFGWASQPDRLEMASVGLNRTTLQRIADRTGGRLLRADELEDFAESLPTSRAPVVEVRSWPVWHQWWIFALAAGCFVTDWTLRRRNGLA